MSGYDPAGTPGAAGAPGAVLVRSVAGRAGDVVLTVADVAGAVTEHGVSAADQAAYVANAPTGNPAVDTPALQAAIDATPEGGRLFLRSAAAHYKINAALSITKNITIEGDAIAPTFTSVTSGGNPTTPSAPFLRGTIIEQTVAATDILQIFTSGVTVNLARLGLLFAAGLASTGHGVNASPSLVVGAGHDIGIQDFHWESVYVYGHDGNHYAYKLLNMQLGTLVHCRSYGGGGFFIEADAGSINAGNLTFIHPYVALSNAGTAGGFVHSGVLGTPGTLNLLTYIRPQVITSGAATVAGTNPLWKDNAGTSFPTYVQVLGADFEGVGPFVPGAGTTFGENNLIAGQNTSNTRFGVGALPGWQSGGSANTAFGNNALQANAAGARNTAFGGAALAANTSGVDNTAHGNLALAANTTGGSNTAVGVQALTSNTTASSSTAVGYQALMAATGLGNTSVGAVTLKACTTGTLNTAVGGQALQVMTTGQNNTAIGQSAGVSVTTGNNNTLVGYKAGVTNTGANALTTGTQNVHIGAFSGFGTADGTWSNTVAIGYQATVVGAGAIAIGQGTSAPFAGSIAIGKDDGGTSAVTTGNNVIALGTTKHNLLLGTGAGLGSGAGVVSIHNALTVPSTNPANGGIMYVEAGALKWRGPSGAVTVMGAA